MHVYEVRLRKDKRGVVLNPDVLPFGRLWYGEPNAITNATSYARFFSRSHDAVICVYDGTGNVIETHEHKGDFQGEAAVRQSLLAVRNRLRCSLAQFKLCANFLNLRRLFFDRCGETGNKLLSRL